jgi:hypothetical protein
MLSVSNRIVSPDFTFTFRALRRRFNPKRFVHMSEVHFYICLEPFLHTLNVYFSVLQSHDWFIGHRTDWFSVQPLAGFLLLGTGLECSLMRPAKPVEGIMRTRLAVWALFSSCFY